MAPDFQPPETFDVLDRHGGFTAITRNHSWAQGYGENSIWRPGTVLKHGTVGKLIPGSVRTNDFYQDQEPLISARYKLPRYPWPVQVWWTADGERIA